MTPIKAPAESKNGPIFLTEFPCLRFTGPANIPECEPAGTVEPIYRARRRDPRLFLFARARLLVVLVVRCTSRLLVLVALRRLFPLLALSIASPADFAAFPIRTPASRSMDRALFASG